LRLPWIRRQVRAFENQPRESQRSYRAGESHWFMGRRYRLRVAGHRRCSGVTVRSGFLDVEVRGEVDPDKTARTLFRWYRSELRSRAEPLVAKWAHKLGVNRPALGLIVMSTRWGSCSTSTNRIWLNLALSRTPQKCLEYVIVHELSHFFVRAHDADFIALLDQHLPDWRSSRAKLAELPYPSLKL
jgi:predicted metal-dependent hydrolase